MYVTKCDGCGKTIKKPDAGVSVSGSHPNYFQLHLCVKCAASINAILKKMKLVKTENRA